MYGEERLKQRGVVLILRSTSQEDRREALKAARRRFKGECQPSPVATEISAEKMTEALEHRRAAEQHDREIAELTALIDSPFAWLNPGPTQSFISSRNRHQILSKLDWELFALLQQ